MRNSPGPEDWGKGIQHVAANWQWCATNKTWFNLGQGFGAACHVCRLLISRERMTTGKIHQWSGTNWEVFSGYIFSG